MEARGFGKDDFAKSHPAGQLGKKLTTRVQDLAATNDKAPIVNEAISLKDALIEVTEKKLGVTLVSDSRKVVGIFTDGDLRRCLNDGVDLNKTPIKDVMTTNFKSIKCNDLAIDAAEIMEKNKIFSLVVIPQPIKQIALELLPCINCLKRESFKKKKCLKDTKLY